MRHLLFSVAESAIAKRWWQTWAALAAMTFLLALSGCAGGVSNNPPATQNTSTPVIQEPASGGHSSAASGGDSTSAASPLIPPSGETSYFQIGQLSFGQVQGVGDVNGAQTQLPVGSVEQSMASVFRSTLFATNSNGDMTVYSPGWPSTSAQLSSKGNGNYSISYDESSDNASASFSGTLSGSQISASYQREGAGGNVVDGQENIGATNYGGSFTAPVTWISPNDIPGPPTGLQIQNNNSALVLSWNPAAGNVAYYAIYRLVGLVNSAQTYLSMTKATTFTDNTALSVMPSGGDEIFYYVYAVGPTGVENPQDAFGTFSTI